MGGLSRQVATKNVIFLAGEHRNITELKRRLPDSAFLTADKQQYHAHRLSFFKITLTLLHSFRQLLLSEGNIIYEKKE